jgi:hypothetical protein
VAGQSGIPRGDALLERGSPRRPRPVSSSTAGDENAQRPTTTIEAGRASPPPPADLDARRLGTPDSDSPPASRGETSVEAGATSAERGSAARSTGVTKPAGNAVDRKQADPAKRIVVFAAVAAQARQQRDLDERQRIDERVTSVDRGLEDRLRVQ